MSKSAVAAKRFGGFMRRNAMYFLIVLCIASVATIIALAVTGNFNGDLTAPATVDDVPTTVDPDDKPTTIDPDDDKPTTVDPTPLTFASPCNGSVTKDYSETVLAWNSTLGQYSAHLGTDFTAEDLKVCAVAAGKVKETGYDLLNGNYVILTHDEGYESRYYSLAETLNVKTGDTVMEGQLLGTMSQSMSTESLDGNHLHFEMSKNGVDVNPVSVLIMNDK